MHESQERRARRQRNRACTNTVSIFSVSHLVQWHTLKSSRWKWLSSEVDGCSGNGVKILAHLFEPSEVAPMHFFALFMITSGRLIDTWRGAEKDSPTDSHNSQSSYRVDALSQHISAHRMPSPMTSLCPYNQRGSRLMINCISADTASRSGATRWWLAHLKTD